MSGSVDVVLPTDNSKVQTHICTLGSGTAFGESILYDMPRNATIITSDTCELLRVEQKDFKILWAVINLNLLPNKIFFKILL